MKRFEEVLALTVKIEGYISNRSKEDDPGGFTIWGISSRSYPTVVPKMLELIKAGKKTEAFAIAKKIYYENYWKKMDCDSHEKPWDMLIFDVAVNSGIGTAKRLLAKGGTWQDFLLLRLEHFTKCKNVKANIHGWANRLVRLYNKSNEKGEI